MCSENTPLRLTNGVLGVFLLTNSIKIVLKRASGFVKQTNNNLTIIDDLKKEIQCLKNILNREGISYQEIVWYGNINLLGKQDVEDHIMRIQSKEIASELMEMTFGNSLYNYLNNF